MALDVVHIGTRHYQQPMGMLVRSALLGEGIDEDDRWVLKPAFQRGEVWTPAQKVAWVETMLSGLALPSIVVNYFPGCQHPVYGAKAIVIDGQQRLVATRDFMQSKFSVRGEYYKDQSDAWRTCFKTVEALTPVVHCSYATERECAELYLKLLTAGTSHTAAEVELARAFIEESDNA